MLQKTTAAPTTPQADRRVSFLLGQMPAVKTMWSLQPRNVVAVTTVHRMVTQRVDNRVPFLLAQLLVMKIMWTQPQRKMIVVLTVPWSVIRHVDK